MSTPLIITLIVCLVLLFFAGSYMLLKDGGKDKARARQIITGQAQETRKKGKDKVDPRDQRRAEIVRKLKEDEQAEGKKKGGSLREKIMQAGLDITVKKYFLYSALLALAVVVLLLLTGMNIPVVMCGAIIAFFGLPRFVLKRLALRRQKKFMEELADVLEAMVRLLKAGMPVSESILMVSKEYSGPVGEEMTRIYDSQKIGIPLYEAAEEATHRMPLTEMKMFATGLAIQAQTGASLSEILTNLAGVVRARYKLKRKIKSLSSEAKASAAIIGSMPVMVAGGIYFINPDHINILFDTQVGNLLLAGAIFWMCTGVFIMKQMINFKV